MADDLFTRGGVSKLTKLAQAYDKHISNFHRARKAGKLVCFKVGAEWYVDRAEWLKYIQRCNGESAPTRPVVEGARREAVGV
jgi:hypothetical protein